MKSFFHFFLAAILTCWISQLVYAQSSNPPAPGFDEAGSDAKAIAIADEVMEAMGGRANWDATRYVEWNFFGARKHLWDRYTGDVRIEHLRNGTLYLFNINSMEGQVIKDGKAYTDADSLKKYIKQGKSAWINDSYWIFMPFKLKDSGVTLSYVGEGKTEAGKDADILELRFKNVGDTPQNKYHVWVEKSPRLVTQWAYFPNASDEEPRFITPWTDYKTYGKIQLAGNRGQRSISEISVMESVDKAKFTKP